MIRVQLTVRQAEHIQLQIAEGLYAIESVNEDNVATDDDINEMLDTAFENSAYTATDDDINEMLNTVFC